MSKRKLKVGLLIDSYKVPLWAYKMIEQIVQSNYAKVSLIVRKQKSIQKKESFFNKIRSNRHELLFRVYSKLEDSIYSPSLNVFELKDLKKLINCTEISPKFFILKYSAIPRRIVRLLIHLLFGRVEYRMSYRK